MRVVLAFLLAAIGQAVIPSRVNAAVSKPTIDGEGNTVRGQEVKGTTSDVKLQPRILPPKRAGKPRFIERGAGDPPPAPALIWKDGFGECVTGGGTILMTDPLINTPEQYPPCPGPARAPGTRPSAPPPPTPLEAAYQAWYWETKLPSPTLAASPPNGAVTGLDFFLTIRGPQHLTFDVPALGYNVHLEVSSLYDVDWGDPKPDGTPLGRAVTKDHRTQGGPYPDGDLRHQYIHRGSATIDVTQKWTARWSAGGQSGTIADRLATSGTLTVPVQEIQAVLVP